MKTGNTYWETEQIGEKERQIENRLKREVALVERVNVIG